jgi:hypothetical protein
MAEQTTRNLRAASGGIVAADTSVATADEIKQLFLEFQAAGIEFKPTTLGHCLREA